MKRKIRFAELQAIGFPVSVSCAAAFAILLHFVFQDTVLTEVDRMIIGLAIIVLASGGWLHALLVRRAQFGASAASREAAGRRTVRLVRRMTPMTWWLMQASTLALIAFVPAKVGEEFGTVAQITLFTLLLGGILATGKLWPPSAIRRLRRRFRVRRRATGASA